MNTDPMADLRKALDVVAAATRVIITHPDHEEGVRSAVAEAPFPGLLKVQVSEDCPRGSVFLIPAPNLKPFVGVDASTPESTETR